MAYINMYDSSDIRNTAIIHDHRYDRKCVSCIIDKSYLSSGITPLAFAVFIPLGKGIPSRPDITSTIIPEQV